MDATHKMLLTFPELASEAGTTLRVLERLVRQRPELARLVLRAGSRRMVLSESLPQIRDLIREDSRR